jgi:copper chaperone
MCSATLFNPSILFPDQVEKVDINLDGKEVYVTSNLSSDELLEVIKKTGKETSYVGLK